MVERVKIFMKTRCTSGTGGSTFLRKNSVDLKKMMYSHSLSKILKNKNQK